MTSSTLLSTYRTLSTATGNCMDVRESGSQIGSPGPRGKRKTAFKALDTPKGSMQIIPPYVDILIIGAGQAGLALGHYLRMTGHSFVLTERNHRIGESWRSRYDSLVLFTPRNFSALPGMTLPGDPDTFPGKDEIADYLERYSCLFNLPVKTGISITRLEREEDGQFIAETDTKQTIRARAVVVATGAFQAPTIPAFAKELAERVTQLNSASYRNPSQLPAGPVLVVGDGATGRQIALELAQHHQVTLAVGRPRRILPSRILGKSVFWWSDLVGLGRMSKDTLLGRGMKREDAFPGQHLKLSALKKQGVRIVGRLVGAAGNCVAFATGGEIAIQSAIWTTGYRDETDWVCIAGATDSAPGFIEDRGVSPIPGLYYIGRSWQTSRGSSLLLGVGRDAQEIRDHLIKWLT